MYFWGKAWGGVPLDTAAKPPAPAGQQPSPPQPRAVLVPGMLLSPSAEAEAGEESAPWILGCRLRQYVPKDLALMQPPSKSRAELPGSQRCLHPLSQRPSAPRDLVFSLHPRVLQRCVG